jgi:hypothetical protein
MTNMNVPPIGFQTLEAFAAPKTGKTPDHIEDKYGFRVNNDGLYWQAVVSDGATSKNGFTHMGLTGGTWAANFVTEGCMESSAHGVELVRDASEYTARNYDLINAEKVVGFAGATLLDARFVRGTDSAWELVVTQVGDSGFRLQRHQGEPVVKLNKKAVDDINGSVRSTYVNAELAALGRPPSDDELKKILAEGRGLIQADLNKQHLLQNKSGVYAPDGRVLGYGVIDGSFVPEEFIKITREPAENVKSLELFSDGYGVLPAEPTIETYEEAWRLQQERDPYAIGADNYPPGTKAGDDRTIVILTDVTH